MKLNKKTLQQLLDEARQQRANFMIQAERQAGVVSMCEWMISNCEFDEELEVKS